MGDLWSSANPVLLRGGGGGGSGNEYDNVDGTETIENGRERGPGNAAILAQSIVKGK